MIKAFIPNILTALNLLCGCFSIAFAFQFQFEVVLILVLLGVFFDYLDGIVARILNAESEFGKHLDSLSDIVTSGVVPGIIVYQLFKLSGNRVTDFNLDLNLEPIINASFPVLMEHYYFFESKEYFLNNYTLILLVVSSFILMNVPFRLFSLRISLRKYDFNIFKILTVVLSIPIILIFGIGGFCLIIILYLFLNVLRNLWSLL